MLKQRIITAVLLIPIVLAGLVYLPQVPLAIIFGVVCLIGLWEWAAIAKLNCCWAKLAYIAVNAGLMGLFYFLPARVLLTFALGVWVVLSLWVVYYPRGSQLWHRTLPLRLFVGTAIILPAWQALLYIRFHQHGLALLFLMLFVIWSMDSGAYFAGRWCGKKPLAPQLSPKKTQEGCYGGLLLAMVVAAIYTYFVLGPIYLTPFFGVVLLTIMLLSVLGDLTESMVKRLADVKDSGKILPGHGGILDRMDSFFAAAPIFAFGVWMIF